MTNTDPHHCYLFSHLPRFSWIVLIAAELVAVTHIFQFRYPPSLLDKAGYPDSSLEFYPGVSPSVLVFCFLIVLFLLNMLPVRQFGQMEYIFGLVKMLFIIVMIVLNVALHIKQPEDVLHLADRKSTRLNS